MKDIKVQLYINFVYHTVTCSFVYSNFSSRQDYTLHVQYAMSIEYVKCILYDKQKS